MIKQDADSKQRMIMSSERSRSGPVSRLSRGNLGKGSDDRTIATAKIGLIATLAAALIAGAATVLVAVIGNDDPDLTMPDGPRPVVGVPPTAPSEPTCSTCAPGGETFTQRVNSGNSNGTTAFRNPYAISGVGPRVANGLEVEVVCRLHTPNLGWMYLIHSPPWSRQYYTPANSYLNGDPPEGPHVSDVDGRVPECGPSR